MENELRQKIRQVFSSYPTVKLGYIFGSQAAGDIGPLSDYDFAVYTDNRNKKENFDLKLEIMGKLCQLLKTDRVDVVILNEAKNTELKYQIIKDGQLIYSQEPYKVLVEPKILNEYFDYHQMLVRHNLTNA